MIMDGDTLVQYSFGGFALHMKILDVGSKQSCFDSLQEAWAWNLDARTINNAYYLRIVSPTFGSGSLLPKMEVDTDITYGDVFFADKDSLKIKLLKTTSETRCDKNTEPPLTGTRLKNLAKFNSSFYRSELVSDNFHVDLQVIIADGVADGVDCIGIELAVIFPQHEAHVYIDRLPPLPNHNHHPEESGIPHLWLIVLMLVIFLLALGFVCWPARQPRLDECTVELQER